MASNRRRIHRKKTQDQLRKRTHNHYETLAPYVNIRDKARKQLKSQQMSNENPERNPRPTKKHKSKKTTSSPTLPPCVIPPNTQPSQTLESSQTSNQVGITHLVHLIEETIETESDLHNPEL